MYIKKQPRYMTIIWIYLQFSDLRFGGLNTKTPRDILRLERLDLGLELVNDLKCLKLAQKPNDKKIVYPGLLLR